MTHSTVRDLTASATCALAMSDLDAPSISKDITSRIEALSRVATPNARNLSNLLDSMLSRASLLDQTSGQQKSELRRISMFLSCIQLGDL